MLARALPGILPDLSHEEALGLHGSERFGLLPGSGLGEATFQSPHHTVTATALIEAERPQGGRSPWRTEVLFLMNSRSSPGVLNAMRQPLRTGPSRAGLGAPTVSVPLRAGIRHELMPMR